MTHIPELTDAEAAVLRCWLLPDDGQREYAVRSTLDRELRSPGSGVVTPNGRRALAAYDAKKRAAIRVEAMTTHFRIRPFAEWHEEDGAVLWFTLPIQLPPWCGTPNDDDWPWVWTKKEDTCWCLLPSFFIDDDAAKFLSKEPTNG